MVKNEELEKNMAETMAQLGVSKEFWESLMSKNVDLEHRIAMNMARLGGSYEFWKRRLTHGWDALEAKLNELQAQGLTMDQIVNIELEKIGVKNG